MSWEEGVADFEGNQLWTNPSKRAIFWYSIEYLGEIVIREGINYDAPKIEAILNW